MLLTGFGLGLVMQVLILAVQNGVDYKDLGTATSLAAFFRSMGGAFGTALLGAVLNDRLIGNLTKALPLADHAHVPQIAREIVGSPAQLKLLPPAIHAAATVAYVHTIDTVFLIATPVVALAFVLSLALPEIRLRKTVHTTAPDNDALLACDRARGRNCHFRGTVGKLQRVTRPSAPEPRDRSVARLAVRLRDTPGGPQVVLRAFLGVTFTYAGLQKLTNRYFFEAANPGSIQAQLHASITSSPIGPLIRLAAHEPVLVGLLIAFGEVAVGLGTLFGLLGKDCRGRRHGSVTPPVPLRQLQYHALLLRLGHRLLLRLDTSFGRRKRDVVC